MATRTEKKRWAAPVPKALVELKKSLKSPEDFEALPDHQKRLVIAADVIEWLDTKKIIATHGQYVTSSERDEGSEDRIDDPTDARTFILERIRSRTPKEKKFCVCAMGAACIATVARANKLQLDGFPTHILGDVANLEDYETPEGDETTPYMEAYFPKLMLRVMEAAFEARDVYPTQYHTTTHFPVLLDSDKEECTKYMPRLESATARMRSVFMNVIRNRGNFDPQDTV